MFLNEKNVWNIDKHRSWKNWVQVKVCLPQHTLIGASISIHNDNHERDKDEHERERICWRRIQMDHGKM